MRQALPAIVLLMVVATLLSCGAAPALAQIPAAQMWPPTGAARDFALIKRAGVYHIFHIQNIEGTDQNWLGHQTSTDLYHWTPQPNVIVGTQKTSPTVKDGRNGWNRDFVWAPSILERDGVYYMFYTGVRQRPWNPSCPGQSYQKTGVAISTDLFTWRLALDPWFTPERTSWALQGDTCTYNYGNFRDPFVMQDPATGEWLMYYVTIPNAAAVAANVSCNGSCASCWYTDVRYAVGVAHAPEGFDIAADWTDHGALWNTYQTWTGGGCYRTWESPHAFGHTRNGQTTWFLFATAGTNIFATDVVFSTNDVSPAAPATAWTFRGMLQNQNIRDPYGNTLSTTGWFATEYFRDPDDGREYFANCSTGPVEIRQMLWRSNTDKFDLVEPFHVTYLASDHTSLAAGTLAHLTVSGRNCVDGIAPRRIGLGVVRLDDQGAPVETIPPAGIGLPDSVTLTSDETVVPWPVQAWSEDSTIRVSIQVADTTSGIRTIPITIAPSGAGQPIEVTGVPTAPVREPSLRALGDTPLSPGLGLQIDLPAPMPARLDLFDLKGRVVRRLTDRDLPAGATVERWDLRDDDGRRVAPGIYYARLVTPRGTRSARLVTLSPR